MIKKLVYGLAIIAGLVSCNDDYTDWASPQSNDSKEPVDKIAFTVEPAVSAIDFVVETAENIQLFTTSLQDGQVSEYALTSGRRRYIMGRQVGKMYALSTRR